MNRLKNILLTASSLLLLGTSIAACGGGDDVSMEPVPAGAECVSGGYRITVNGESHLSCNSDPSSTTTSEFVAIDAPGNPCLTPAIKITIQTQGQAPAEAWVCQEITKEDATPLAKYLVTIFEIYQAEELSYQEHRKDCDPDQGGLPEGAIETFRTYYATQHRLLEQCIFKHAAILPPLSAEQNEVLACRGAINREVARCYDTTVDIHGDALDFCDDSDENLDLIYESLDACFTDVEDPDSCEDNMEQEDREIFYQTFNNYQSIALVNCAHLIDEIL